MRAAIRDAVNRPSRKPFYWGGLNGYEQLQAIAQALQSVRSREPETLYLQRLRVKVERVLEESRNLAQDVQAAHTWLKRIAECLRYPPSSCSTSDIPVPSVTSEQVKQEMGGLLQEFQPDFWHCPAQTALDAAWHRLCETCGSDLLHCYDIPGLPPDNLKLEALFGRLRSRQRRISGRKSTRELRDFGQYQVLFLAESEDELLQQLRQVPLAEYQAHRRRLAAAGAPRQFLRRLHRNPFDTVNRLVDQHAVRRATLASSSGLSPP